VFSILAGLGAGLAWALWSDQATSGDVSFSVPVAGFAVTKGGEANVAQSSSGVSFTIGEPEAQQLFASTADDAGVLAIAVPFDVTMTTSGRYTMDYSITMPDAPGADTVLGTGNAAQTFFRVDDSVGCTVDAAASAASYTLGTPVAGITSVTSDVQKKVDHWCLVLSITPEKFENTATATGTNAVGAQVSSQDTWSTYLTPDPAGQTSVSVMLTPALVAGW